jgi:hypothetical protein
MSDIFTVTDDCEQDLLNLIEKYLKELPTTDKPKIYFSGEYDSQQTEFESGSNKLKLGVLAYNETVALVLLRFLRIIIDDVTDFLTEDSFCTYVSIFDTKSNCITEIEKIDKEIEIKEIIKRISEGEETYIQSFSLDQPIHTNFVQEEYNFTKRLDEIDIWTLPRIMKEMRDLY